METATFWRRAGAFLIDLFLVAVLANILFLMFFGEKETTEVIDSGLDWSYTLTYALVMLIYLAVLEGAAWSATVGKLVFGIKVISRTNDELGFLRSLQRNLLKIFISQLLFGFGFWMALFRKDHLAFHDLAPKTVVALKRSLPESSLKNESSSLEHHSGIGIASFIISIVSGVSLIALFLLSVILAPSVEGFDENSKEAMILGLLLFACLFVLLLGIGLGIGGLFQKNRKRLFAILGLFVSALVLLGSVSLVMVGSTLE